MKQLTLAVLLLACSVIGLCACVFDANIKAEDKAVEPVQSEKGT